MNKDFVDQIIASKTHCFFVSPHLDDAIFSAGGLISKLTGKTKVTVINVFTSCGNSNSSLSARVFLKQCGYKSKEDLFVDRVKEDKSIFTKLGVEVINLGEVDALWRQKNNLLSKILGRILPELGNIYPTYRFHIISGRISRHDSKLIKNFSEKIFNLLPESNYLVFSPIGIGNHIDHIAARKAVLRVVPKNKVIFWSDFPYAIHPSSKTDFFNKHKLLKISVHVDLQKKIKACKFYASQFSKVITSVDQILNRETYYQINENIFPEKLGKFTFSRSFQAEDAMSNYEFALYKDKRGDEFFVKKYSGSKKTKAYKFLVNEINTYKFFGNLKHKGTICTPKLTYTEETIKDLYLVIEFIKGSTVKSLSPAEKVKTFEKVIHFFNTQNISKISKFNPIMQRSPLYWSMLLPVLILIAIVKNKKSFVHILMGFILVLKYLPKILSRSERGLIHRDFNDHNIIVKNGKTFPIDFQLASIADPLIERAIIYLKYYEKDEMISEINKTPAMKQIFSDSVQHNVLRAYVSIFCIYDLCLDDGSHDTSLRCLKSLINNKL